MDTLVEDEHLRTSTPVESLDVPHLLDPGEDLSDSKGDDRETPDFVVRLGTSLARSEAGSQYKLLKKEFFLRPLDSPKVSKQNQSANSGGTSIRSSGRMSPIRRRAPLYRWVTKTDGVLLYRCVTTTVGVLWRQFQRSRTNTYCAGVWGDSEGGCPLRVYCSLPHPHRKRISPHGSRLFFFFRFVLWKLHQDLICDI